MDTALSTFTMNNVAVRSCMSYSLLRRYFANREVLVEALVARSSELSKAFVDDAIMRFAKHATLASISELGISYSEFLTRHYGLYCAWFMAPAVFERYRAPIQNNGALLNLLIGSMFRQASAGRLKAAESERIGRVFLDALSGWVSRQQRGAFLVAMPVEQSIKDIVQLLHRDVG